MGSAQHGDFMTQHQQLDVLRRRRAAEQQQQVQQLKEDQVEQAQRHGARSAVAAKYTDHPGQRHRSTSGTPQEASDTSDSGKGFFSGRSVAFWTILGSVATVLSLLVAVVTLVVSTRAPTPAQQGEATGPIRPGTPTAGLAESIPVGASPSSLAMAPDGHHAYVTIFPALCR